MSNYLFLISISPVQSFISQARKTKDLFAGSSILSQLICKVVVEMEENNIIVIFPKSRSSKSMPNKILATMQADNDGEVKKVLGKYEIKMRANFFQVDSQSSSEDARKKQLDDFLKVFWVAVPIQDNEYKKEDYRLLMERYGLIKNIYPFHQLPEKGRKCSLCGERNVLHCKKGEEKKMSPGTQNEKLIKSTEGHLINPNEGLCAVCFKKRNFSSGRYPSTAKIALMQTLNNFSDKTILCEYKNMYDDYLFDEQLFYEENLTKHYFQNNGYGNLILKLNSLKAKRSGIESIMKEKKLKLNKYYALVMCDGDNMGDWLSGRYLKEQSKIKDFHEALSKAQSEFANFKLKNPAGRKVYGGGDDMLAFVNLYHLFDVVERMKKDFADLVHGSIKDDLIENAPPMTLSFGIVVAHYKNPLKEVLNYARKALEDAKKKFKHESSRNPIAKNAVGITFITKSHNVTTVFFKNDHFALLKDLFTIFQDQETGLSSTFVQKLAVEFRHFETVYSFAEYQKIKGIMSAELKRLMKRACRNKDKFPRELYSALVELLNGQFVEDRENKHVFEGTNFFNFLKIADSLAREVDYVYENKAD